MPKDSSKPVTPNNPSFSATKRVKNPLPVPTVCDICSSNSIVSCTNDKVYSSKKYGEWPWIYMCNDCKSYVGMHPFTNIPLGSLANYELRMLRTQSKKVFYEYMDSTGISRTQAYVNLAKAMKMTVNECHFGWFKEDDCKRAIVALRELIDQPPSNSPFTVLKKLLKNPK